MRADQDAVRFALTETGMHDLVRSILQSVASARGWPRVYRRLALTVVHLLLWTIAFLGAFWLRYEFRGDFFAEMSPWWLVALLGVRTVSFASLGAFEGLWRYTGVRDLLALLKATTLGTVVFAALMTLMGVHNYPRSVFIIEYLGSVTLVAGLRFAGRLVQEAVAQSRASVVARRILIVGAGNAGEMLLREIQKCHARRYLPVGFVDDNPNKLHGRIHGVRVLGTLADVTQLVQRYAIDEIIITIPAATGRAMRTIVETCCSAGVPVRTVPGLDQVIDGRITLKQVRDVAIEDLLGRQPVALDSAAVSEFLSGQRVLVTGAGGSIGSELCRQVCRFHPERLILVEQAENALFTLEQSLGQIPDTPTWVSYIADITDVRRMQNIFADERPTIILHAAAHKHVPMMERNPGEAIKNNTLGTRTVADFAVAFGVERFVMISTDKAVNPTSVMGATKRAAEMYVQALDARSETRFSIVRFGNVLGSAGSVIPIFKEQIARGGPITVTHPDMQRYFMTIPEACQLVLQAGAMGHGGELFILDMGDPVRIVDLARDLIALSGLVPGDDIEIAFTGIRRGEKLHEELSLAGDNVAKTLHPKIFVGRGLPPPMGELQRAYARLQALVDGDSPVTELRAALRELVDEYRPADVRPASAPALVTALRA